MLFIILALIITPIFCYLYEEKHGGFRWRYDGGMLVLMTILMAACGAVVSLIPSAILECNPPELNYELVETKEIYALEDNITHGGRYYLGSGAINGDAAYFYIVEEDFGLKTKSKDTDYAYVKYTTESPSVEYYNVTFKNPFYKWITLWGPYDICRFNVPEGSVTSAINVDLE